MAGAERRLILVEGLSGSGKTTTVRQLAERLAERGVSAVAYWESHPENPIVIGPILPDLSGTIRRYIGRSDFLGDWRRLVQRLQREDCTVLLESRLVQNAAMFRILANHSADDACLHTARIVECIEGLDPLLIYLRMSDPSTHARRALETSPRDWVRLALTELERTPWFRSRRLAGCEGWVEFQRHWASLLDELVRSLQIEVLTVTDPHRDWEEALSRGLAAALGAESG